MQFESDVPIPPNAGQRTGRPNRYAFPEMRVGDSFIVPAVDGGSLRSAASQHKDRHPDWNYATRLEGDVVRLWRIAVPNE